MLFSKICSSSQKASIFFSCSTKFTLGETLWYISYLLLSSCHSFCFGLRQGGLSAYLPGGTAKTALGCVALDRRKPALRRAPACLRPALPIVRFSLAPPFRSANKKPPHPITGRSATHFAYQPPITPHRVCGNPLTGDIRRALLTNSAFRPQLRSDLPAPDFGAALSPSAARYGLCHRGYCLRHSLLLLLLTGSF